MWELSSTRVRGSVFRQLCRKFPKEELIRPAIDKGQEAVKVQRTVKIVVTENTARKVIIPCKINDFTDEDDRRRLGCDPVRLKALYVFSPWGIDCS